MESTGPQGYLPMSLFSYPYVAPTRGWINKTAYTYTETFSNMQMDDRMCVYIYIHTRFFGENIRLYILSGAQPLD